MPVTYRIEKARRLLVLTATGVVTAGEVREWRQAVGRDPDFAPDHRALFDGTAVTKFDLSTDDVYAIVAAPLFARNARRAFVATNRLGFGLARMFESLRAMKGETGIRVFSSREQAMAWLESPPGDSAHPFG